MSFYEEHIAPHLVSLACSARPIARQRAKVVPGAEGRVLEVGFGSGLNLPFYDPEKVTQLFALEPSAGMRRKAASRAAAVRFPIDYLDLPGETVPLEDASVDTVLVTYTLCTIDAVARAVGEMRRVLKPSGRLLFCEHGAAPDADVRRFQRRIGPLWTVVGAGCRLDRPIPELVSAGGFTIERLEAMYLPKTPRFAGYNYWGSARPG
ncbi:MAG: methyltransferase domain-containing protein [Alphaproteobacteria bacterium]|nr:methyltransferase domain-containing protein [Alphaproteobacteria bacterium]